MNIYGVMQSRGNHSFLVAVFMADFDANRFAGKQNKVGFYTYEVVQVDNSQGWCLIEKEAQ